MLLPILYHGKSLQHEPRVGHRGNVREGGRGGGVEGERGVARLKEN